MTRPKRTIILGSAAFLGALFYTMPFFLRMNNWGVRDWDLFTTIAAVPAGSIQIYSQFPFWNPYLAGGNILFHHPEVAVFSPFLILYLAFGAVVGLKIQVFLAYLLGFWGSFRMGRTLGLSDSAAVLLAAAYFGSVHFALHFAEGHIPFTHFCFFPWFLYFLLSAAKNRRNLLWASAALALMILGNGAAIPLLYTLTFTGLYFAIDAIMKKRGRGLVDLAAATAGGFGLAAVKFVPMLFYLLENRWEGSLNESIPFSALSSIFFGWNHSLFARNFVGQEWAWHEYGAYLSPIIVLLALYAIARRSRPTIVWAALGLFFLLLGMGNFGSLSPWNLLSHFPGFASARCTGRAFQFVILSVAVLGCFGFDLLRTRLQSISRQTVRIIPWLLGTIVVVTNLLFAWPIMSSAFPINPPEVHRSDEFRQVVDEKPQAYQNYLANRGSLISPWLSAYHPSRGLVDVTNNVLSEHFLSGSGTILQRHFTPNQIDYKIDAESKAELVIGMGYDRGWLAEDGRRLFERQGLIAFNLEPGLQTVVLTYRTPYFAYGLATSLLFVIGLALLRRRL